MPHSLVQLSTSDHIATITLNDPAKRNALSLKMFDEIDAALAEVVEEDQAHVVLLQGQGKAFCAGFDLAPAINDTELIGQYILRLSSLNRQLRRLPQVVIASVQGAAIAGGCAILSACDFVVMSEDAKVGYPVHAIGVSPAVTIPTLSQAIGVGAARALLMSGELIDGKEAHRLGLATHLVDSIDKVNEKAASLCAMMAAKPREGVRTTKAWLNELDGSLDDERFDRPAQGSLELTKSKESRELLERFWSQRSLK